jgi:hypothetical protein
MILNETMAMDVISNPKQKAQIQSAQRQESQMRVFTEDMEFEELSSETYWGKLMKKMEKRSPTKFNRVIEFARYPLPVVQLCDSVLNDFFKVFEGKNRYFNVESDRDISRLNQWIQDYEPQSWIERYAKQVFKNKPCSFVVIDRDENAIPYMVFVDSKRLIDAKFKDEKGNLEYICFIHSQKQHPTKNDVLVTFFSVYDDKTFFVFSKDSDTDKIVKISAVEHGIGYCPAKAFIETESNQKNKFKRRVTFTSALPKLEDWTIFDIFRNFVDHYAPFPVTEAPINVCGNNECVDGKVPNEVIVDARTDETETHWSDCPVCGGRDQGQHIYPGTHIGIKVRTQKDENDGSGVFKMHYPDAQSLKYTPEKLNELELDIRYKTSGVNTLMSNEAFNKLQVKGSFASMESILMRTKGELDELYEFIVTTVGKLMYKNLTIKVEANFGTEYYLISEEDLQKRFDEAKKIGLPMEEMLMIYIQLIETKYKGNETKIKRQKMLIELDPLPLFSITESFALYEKKLISEFDLTQKVQFLNFIAKFEAENAPIIQFGITLAPTKRVEKIKETLNIYTNEYIKSKSLQPSDDGSQGT